MSNNCDPNRCNREIWFFNYDKFQFLSNERTILLWHRTVKHDWPVVKRVTDHHQSLHSLASGCEDPGFESCLCLSMPHVTTQWRLLSLPASELLCIQQSVYRRGGGRNKVTKYIRQSVVGLLPQSHRIFKTVWSTAKLILVDKSPERFSSD